MKDKMLFELKEIFDYIKVNGRITRDHDYKFSDGGSMYNFLYYNKERLYEMAKNNKMVLFIVNNQWENKLSFDDKLLQAYVFINSYGNIYRSSDLHFTDGSNVYEWLNNNFEKLDEMEDYKARFICGRLCWRIEAKEEFLLKLYEIYLFLGKGGLLTAKRDVNFSVDNSSLFYWFRNKKKDVYMLSFTNDLAKAVVCELERIKPKYFEKIKKELLKENNLLLDSSYDILKNSIMAKQKMLKK